MYFIIVSNKKKLIKNKYNKSNIFRIYNVAHHITHNNIATPTHNNTPIHSNTPIHNNTPPNSNGK